VVAEDDDTAGRRLLPYLRRHAGRNLLAGHFVAALGGGDRYLGAVCSLVGTGDPDAHFERALAMEQAMDAPVHRAETLARFADHLDGRDAVAAAERRSEAHELAVRLGMRALAQRTEPEGRRRAPGAGAAPLPDRLTAREVEVLRCLARGLSNREISAALFIAENTVANHVRSIMQKTHSANRTQAAMYAARRDLL
jgi:DNA-binding CsgD family transcriptional regulator